MTTHDPLSFPSTSPLPPIRGPIIPETTPPRDSTLHSLSSRPTTTNPEQPAEDPSFSSKLTNVEAQRIMSVLQDMQRKVQLIGLLPDHMDRRVSSVFGGETVAVITVSLVEVSRVYHVTQFPNGQGDFSYPKLTC